MTIAPNNNPAILHREAEPGLDAVVVARGGLREFHFTIHPLAGETPMGMAVRLHEALKDWNAVVVRHEAFGSISARKALGPDFAPWPVTWVEGASCDGREISGMHVMAVEGATVAPALAGGREVGRVFEDGHARHCLLGGVASDAGADRGVQARQVFERIEEGLAAAGIPMIQLPRTWLFLDDILAWYELLNRVRREFFQQRNLFDHLVPASTGVGVRNPSGAAMVAGAWGARPLHDGCRIGEVLSPMQCPAPQYGSCFARASEIVAPDLRRVFVSGTASIEPKGKSVCAGDMDGQVDLTLQVVRAILVSRGMDWPDITRATAYIRHPADAPLFHQWVSNLGLESMPLITTQAVVCRDELLFEIEVDAMAPLHSAAPG
jgi:enamine deaminase RidA (YjgF/YER057c/UK114 family)